MAEPEGVTPLYNQVVISPYNGVSGFGIQALTAGSKVGTVYKIGSNVYRIEVGQKVGFKTEAMFATDAGETFVTTDQNNVYINYTPVS